MPVILDLFLTFFKIGAFTFGGGYAMIALIQSEVLSHGWTSQTMLVDMVAISESTPGPIAINAATYVGMHAEGIMGAFIATLGVVLPSFIIILIVARLYAKFKESLVVRGCMRGLKPAVVGLVATAIYTSVAAILTGMFGDGNFYWSEGLICTLVIFMVSLALEIKKAHPIAIISVAAVLGIICGYSGLVEV